VAVFFSTSIGLTLGSLAGYYGGWFDQIIMRVVDVVLSFPVIILLLCVASLVGPSIFNVMAMIGLLTWPTPCRIMRGQFLTLRERAFVEAAHCLGVTDFQIAVRHIIPNAIAPVLVYASFAVATAVLLEAGLSYLGLGVQPPTPSWGNMLNTARNISTMERTSWQWVPPAIMTVLFVLAVNFVGDGVRDALDPQAKE
jgi:peptide/nickel transport system permease protein